MTIAQSHQIGATDAQGAGVRRMDFDKGLGQVRRKAGGFAGAGHGVPMVAHAAGIENEPARRRRKGRRRLDRQEARLAIGGEELAIAKHAGGGL